MKAAGKRADFQHILRDARIGAVIKSEK